MPPRSGKGGNQMNIYVGNLSYDAGEDDLRKLFEEYGSVESVNVITDRMTNRSKGFGFIEMNDDDEAKKAIEELDGKEHLGRDLKVNVARPRKEKRDRSW